MRKKQVVILGAGISGLSLAWFLKQKHGNTVDLTIIEKSSRVGGWIRSIHKEGFLFELGPHSIRAQGANVAALELVEQLGIQQSVIFPASSAKLRYLLSNQKLMPLPNSFWSLIASPLLFNLLQAAWRDLGAPKCGLDDESVYHFVSRRFGKKIVEKFFDPLVSGIYAGDIRNLSIKACFPFLHRMEQEHGSVIRGLWKKERVSNKPSDFVQHAKQYGMFSFQEGLEFLPQELERRLSQSLVKSCVVQSMDIDDDFMDLKLSNGNVIRADHVFSTIPVESFSQLLGVRLSENLRSTSVVVINMGYNAFVLEKRGFGYLVPSNEKEEVLGVIWHSEVFPQQNKESIQTRLTVMMGGARQEKFCLLSQEEQIKIAKLALQKHLNIEREPDRVHVSVAQNAIPQYQVGHMAELAKIRKLVCAESSRITLLGAEVNGVSLNDCIAEARKLAESFLCE